MDSVAAQRLVYCCDTVGLSRAAIQHLLELWVDIGEGSVCEILPFLADAKLYWA